LLDRSLALKLVLAFMLVSLIGVILVALFSRFITEREFDRLTQAQARADFVNDVTNYYEITGSLQGIARIFPPPGQQPPQLNQQQPQLPPPPPASRPQFGLADKSGYFIIPGAAYRDGDRVPPRLLAAGEPLEIDDQVVATIIVFNHPPPRNPLEEQYLDRINQALIIAAIVATLVAVSVGVFLARTLTRPLQQLTAATQALAHGELPQAVLVRSKDELGQLATAFNQMSNDLTTAIQQRRQMTADIAHDLRTPLTVISGYLEALRDGDLSPTQARFEAMYEEAQHLGRLISDLRTLSLADAGELTLTLQPVVPAELLSRIMTAYQHQAAQLQVELIMEVLPDIPEVIADWDRLVQVFGNLLNNALRFTPAGGQITLSAEPQPNGVLLRVSDTGAGIPADELPHIFSRFYRVDKARSQQAGESGLGLAIARVIVESHQGHISAESKVGAGTTFAIYLPAHQ
jgi:two-component system sensor histidine kinase BaeS